MPRRVVGTLGRPHGLQGMLGLWVDPGDLPLVASGSTVFIDGRPYVVRSLSGSGRGLRIAFHGVSDRESAEALRGLVVTAAADPPIGNDAYLVGNLIGCRVVTERGEDVGDVVDVVIGGAQDRLVVRGSNVQFEVPLVAALVPEIDVEAAIVVISEIPGLIPRSH